MTTGNLSALLGGSRPPISLVNGVSSGGVTSLSFVNVSDVFAKQILSGAVTANVLKSVLTITGAGAVQYLSAYVKDATSRTVRLRVTIDGTVVFDATSAAITTSYKGLLAIGSVSYDGANACPGLANVAFNSSLLVEVASSVSETDKVAINTIYETR